MSYPQLHQKIDLLHKKYKLDPAAIAQKINKDKATAWRWMFQRTERISLDKQQLLVRAICETLGKPEVTEPIFKSNNLKIFCQRAGLTKFEAAVYSGFTVPVPDLILDSLFDMTGDVHKYEGYYILYRHDKAKEEGDDKYIQTCVRIYASDRDLLVYEDFAVGKEKRVTYEGYIYLVGSILNIIGQSKMLGRATRAELWWSGLKVGSTENNDQAKVLYGYVSDLTDDGTLYADRLVLLRIDQNEWDTILKKHAFSDTRRRAARPHWRCLHGLS